MAFWTWVEFGEKVLRAFRPSRGSSASGASCYLSKSNDQFATDAGTVAAPIVVGKVLRRRGRRRALTRVLRSFSKAQAA
jgi:hypothetical protein